MRRSGTLIHLVLIALPRVLIVLAALFAWSLVFDLIVNRNVGAIAGVWSPARLIAYVLFILAPGVTFVPIARALRIPLYPLEAIVGWTTLLVMLTFVDPGSQPPLPILLLLLVSLVIALATIFTLVSYAIGFRLYARRAQRYDFVRARREGYLAAMFLTGLLLLSLLAVLTLVNAALLGLIVFLLEVFLLSRGSPPERAIAPPRAATDDPRSIQAR